MQFRRAHFLLEFGLDEHVAQDEQGPPLAHDLERAGHRAVEVERRAPLEGDAEHLPHEAVGVRSGLGVGQGALGLECCSGRADIIDAVPGASFEIDHGIALVTFTRPEKRLKGGLVDQGVEDYSLESAICKVSGTEFLWYAANRALQLRGGVGMFTGRPAFVWLSNAFQNSGCR